MSWMRFPTFHVGIGMCITSTCLKTLLAHLLCNLTSCELPSLVLALAEARDEILARIFIEAYRLLVHLRVDARFAH